VAAGHALGQGDAVREDDSRPRRRVPLLVRRLASPAGLILAGFCLLLPFLTASCASEEEPRSQWRLTYTGIDVVTGGRPEIAMTEDADKTPIHPLDDDELEEWLGAPLDSLPTLPLAWPAAALLLAALAATAVPSRAWRTTTTGGLALAAAVLLAGATVLARHDATDTVASLGTGLVSDRVASPPPVPELRQSNYYGGVSDMFRYAWGLWITLGLLAVVGVANTVEAVRRPPADRDRTAPTASADSGTMS
jgi:hypothetical protein